LVSLTAEDFPVTTPANRGRGLCGRDEALRAGFLKSSAEMLIDLLTDKDRNGSDATEKSTTNFSNRRNDSADWVAWHKGGLVNR
jgi:hypothetical protein